MTEDIIPLENFKQRIGFKKYGSEFWVGGVMNFVDHMGADLVMINPRSANSNSQFEDVKKHVEKFRKEIIKEEFWADSTRLRNLQIEWRGFWDQALKMIGRKGAGVDHHSARFTSDDPKGLIKQPTFDLLRNVYAVLRPETQHARALKIFCEEILELGSITSECDLNPTRRHTRKTDLQI